MNPGPAQTHRDSSLAETEIHDVLRNDRRRLVLERLAETEERQSVSDLAEYIAGVESGEQPPPRNVRQSVYVSLHQTHLPKLDDLGIVTYDADAKTVERAENADDVAVYMEVVPKNALSWASYYFTVSLLGLLTILAHRVDVPVLAQADAGLLGAFFFVVICVSAAYHHFTQRDAVGWLRD
jgi:predicted transcriptional regulator